MVAIALFICLLLGAHSYASVATEKLQQPGATRFDLSSLVPSSSNMFSNGVAQASLVASGVKTQAVDWYNTGSQATKNAVATATASAFNALIGAVVSNFNTYNRLTGSETFDLLPIDTKLLGVGSLKTSGGRLGKLSSMKLDGQCSFNTVNGRSRASIPISFEDLTASYGSYTLNTVGGTTQGTLKANIKKVSFVADIVMQISLNCQVTVERVQVTAFEGITVDMTGLPTWIPSVITSIANYLRGIIQAQLQRAVDTGLRSSLKQNSVGICSSSNL